MKKKADTKDKPAIYYEKKKKKLIFYADFKQNGFKINTLLEILKNLIP